MTYQEIYRGLKKKAMKKEAAPILARALSNAAKKGIAQGPVMYPGSANADKVPAGLPRGYLNALAQQNKARTPYEAAGAFVKDLFTNGNMYPSYQLGNRVGNWIKNKMSNVNPANGVAAGLPSYMKGK